MELIKIISFYAWIILGVICTIINLKNWWVGNVKENKYQMQIDILKENNKPYYYIIMILISLCVITITMLLWPVYVLDYINDNKKKMKGVK